MAWHQILEMSELAPGDMKAVQVEGLDIAIYRVGDDVYVTQGMCTHGDAILADGLLDGNEVECPYHSGIFDVRTGEPLDGPVTVPLRVFPVRLENDFIFVKL